MMSTRLLTILALVTLTACGGDGPTNPNSSSIAGTYTLRTISGSPLPFVIQQGANRATITNDVLTVTDGGTWSETATFTVSVNGGAGQQQVTSASGTYTRVGSALGFFDTSSRETDTATISGTTITFTDSRVFTR